MRPEGRVCVIGLWHLGSVVSACLADLGYFVTGLDSDRERVEDLSRGIPPLFEPGLEELTINGINSGRLSYTSDPGKALSDSEYVLITFDVPVDENDRIDLSEIFSISSPLANHLMNGSVVIVSSQVPVGTCERIKSAVLHSNPSLDFDIAYSPENLRLGQAIDCFMNPQRIVIGAECGSTLDKVERFFGVIDAPKMRMDLRSAEMSKHALNAFLATTISFANEIANLCDELGADARKVSEALHSDERIGQRLPLKPGLAFSGGTLARDLKVLQTSGDDLRCETYLIDGVLSVNERQNRVVAMKLGKVYGSVKGLTVGMLGLTYKAGTSTLRRSAALEIIGDLVREGAVVKAYDPHASPEEIKLHPEFEFKDDPYAAAADSDALVIVTDWPEFARLDFDRIKSLMRHPVIIDAKNMLDGEELTGKGFVYSGIGTGHRLTVERANNGTGK